MDTRIEHGQKSVFLIKIFVERIMVDSMIFNDITHLTRRVSFSVFNLEHNLGFTNSYSFIFYGYFILPIKEVYLI